MTDLVPATEIEQIVGAKRHKTEHVVKVGVKGVLGVVRVDGGDLNTVLVGDAHNVALPATVVYRPRALPTATPEHLDALAEMIAAGIQPYQMRYLAALLGGGPRA